MSCRASLKRGAQAARLQQVAFLDLPVFQWVVADLRFGAVHWIVTILPIVGLQTALSLRRRLSCKRGQQRRCWSVTATARALKMVASNIFERRIRLNLNPAVEAGPQRRPRAGGDPYKSLFQRQKWIPGFERVRKLNPEPLQHTRPSFPRRRESISQSGTSSTLGAYIIPSGFEGEAVPDEAGRRYLVGWLRWCL